MADHSGVIFLSAIIDPTSFKMHAWWLVYYSLMDPILETVHFLNFAHVSEASMQIKNNYISCLFESKRSICTGIKKNKWIYSK